MDKPYIERKKEPIHSRFLRQTMIVDNTDDCWEWKGSRDKLGRGKICFFERGKKAYLHAARFSFGFFWKEEIGDLFVLHRCNNCSCVNPSHLYLGDHKQNMRDRTACGNHLHVPKGEEKSTSKLKSHQVVEIRNRWKNRKTTRVSLRKMAKEYGVCHQLLSAICRSNRWAHIEEIQ